CSRCLTEMDVPVQVEFDEEYFPLALGPTEARGLEAVDESQYIDYDNILDIGVAAGQYLTMAVPMKPMCREDCAGICQSCGADLNKGACTCAERDRDARWAALRGLAIATPDIQNLSEN
ncbi:MAG: DUF177 domain-containing protein, partial [SAR202 cluster bacterium]|nr:DUF177 domain-containing protein [SAR202 cluster bacterium]